MRYKSANTKKAIAARRAASDALAGKWSGSNYTGPDLIAYQERKHGRQARVAGMSRVLLDKDFTKGGVV